MIMVGVGIDHESDIKAVDIRERQDRIRCARVNGDGGLVFVNQVGEIVCMIPELFYVHGAPLKYRDGFDSLYHDPG
jgi:hypothetical protein